MTKGVPQRLIFRPILFYVGKFWHTVPVVCDFKLHANDTNLFFTTYSAQFATQQNSTAFRVFVFKFRFFFFFLRKSVHQVKAHTAICEQSREETNWTQITNTTVQAQRIMNKPQIHERAVGCITMTTTDLT